MSQPGEDDEDELPPAGNIGRFTVLHRVGGGRTGRIYAAYDPHLDRRVAVKVLRGDADRSVREARALARLSHANVVAVHDVGTADGRAFIAMEFVQGDTLAVWATGDRSLLARLDRLAQAARGLEAAHRAGFAHGDFKAADVLCGEDDRVRVADFGLAPAETSPDELRADVRAFCTIAWRILFGRTPEELHDDPGVPTQLVAALRRGLAGDASMAHVRAALDRAHRSQRRGSPKHMALWLTAAIALGSGLTFAVVKALQSEDPSCASGQAELAQTWNDTRRASVREAFESTGVPFAPAAADNVERSIDRYAQAWVEGYADACEATLVRGEQPAALMDLRVACLDRQRRALEATVAVLSEASPKTVRRSGQLTAALPAARACSDADYVTAAVKPPTDPAQAAAVQALDDRLALIKARMTAAAFEGIDEQLETLEATAADAGYTPSLAEIALLRAQLAHRKANPDEAGRLATRAYALARGAGDARIAFSAANLILHQVSAKGDVEAATRWALVARAEAEATTRAKNVAEVHDALGEANGHALRFAEAKVHFERALAELGEVDTVQRANTMGDLSTMEWKLGNTERARALLAESLAGEERLLGATHPTIAITMFNGAEMDRESGDLEEAGRKLERGLSIATAVYGEAHPLVASFHQSTAQLHGERGDVEAATEPLRRAVASLEDSGTRGAQIVQALSALSQNLAYLQRYDEAEQAVARARKLARELPGVVPRTSPSLGWSYIQLERGDVEGALATALGVVREREEELGAQHRSLEPALFAVASALRAAERHAEALDVLLRARAVLPSEDASRQALQIDLATGRCLQELGRTAEARERFGRTLERSRDHHEDLANEARSALQELGDG